MMHRISGIREGGASYQFKTNINLFKNRKLYD
jgi:hypothetical protein